MPHPPLASGTAWHFLAGVTASIPSILSAFYLQAQETHPQGASGEGRVEPSCGPALAPRLGQSFASAGPAVEPLPTPELPGSRGQLCPRQEVGVLAWPQPASRGPGAAPHRCPVGTHGALGL